MLIFILGVLLGGFAGFLIAAFLVAGDDGGGEDHSDWTRDQ